MLSYVQPSASQGFTKDYTGQAASRTQKTLKDSKRIKKIPNESKIFQKNQKDSKRIKKILKESKGIQKMRQASLKS